MKVLTIAAIVVAALAPNTTHALHFTTDTGLDINTKKIAIVSGVLDGPAAMAYQKSMLDTLALPGDRLVVIDSVGGYTAVGNDIMYWIRAERLTGTRIVCLVTSKAASMAFTVLSTCDVRLAVQKARLLAHKVRRAVSCPGGCTAKMLRAAAADLDYTDEPYRRINAMAMGLSLEDYDLFADNETVWTAATLRARGYLHGIATIVK